MTTPCRHSPQFNWWILLMSDLLHMRVSPAPTTFHFSTVQASCFPPSGTVLFNITVVADNLALSPGIDLPSIKGISSFALLRAHAFYSTSGVQMELCLGHMLGSGKAQVQSCGSLTLTWTVSGAPVSTRPFLSSSDSYNGALEKSHWGSEDTVYVWCSEGSQWSISTVHLHTLKHLYFLFMRFEVAVWFCYGCWRVKWFAPSISLQKS